MAEIGKKQNGEESACVYTQRVGNSGQIEVNIDGQVSDSGNQTE